MKPLGYNSGGAGELKLPEERGYVSAKTDIFDDFTGSSMWFRWYHCCCSKIKCTSEDIYVSSGLPVLS